MRKTLLAGLVWLASTWPAMLPAQSPLRFTAAPAPAGPPLILRDSAAEPKAPAAESVVARPPLILRDAAAAYRSPVAEPGRTGLPLIPSNAAAAYRSPATEPGRTGPPLILRDAGSVPRFSASQPAPAGPPLILRDAAAEPEAPAAESAAARPPLILRDAGSAARSPADLEAAILQLREQMRAVAGSSVSAAQKQAAVEKIVSEHPQIFRRPSPGMQEQSPATVEAAILLLEQRLYEAAAEIAPDEETRRRLQKSAPVEQELEPLRPILIARKAHRDKIIVTRTAEAQGYTPWWKSAAVAQDQPAAATSPPVQESREDQAEENVVTVEYFADEQVTAEMHDDTTVLRNVANDEGDLVLFDALHLWIGGAAQLDAGSMAGLFSDDQEGDRKGDSGIRRAEGILRASLADLGEVKLQYDFDSSTVRDLYWRWVSETTSQTVTIGNQKEPLGIDYLMGNKFGTAMERSAPASAFGAYRSRGLRFNRWFDVSPEQTRLDVWGENRTYLTSTVGIYTQDIESSHETDWAITGRISGGAQRRENSGIHLGISGSYRRGEFDSIAPRPEVQEAARIELAEFEAEQQAVLGLEAMYARGSLHSQAEFYYSDYRGGGVNAQGFGAYAQLGWLFGGHERDYRARWGLWGPVNTRSQHVFEAFGRISYTRGEDDNHSWNDLRVLTLGGNWYYRQLRGSLNLLLAETRRDVAGEGAGNAITARVQYLF